MALVGSLFHGSRIGVVELALAICCAICLGHTSCSSRHSFVAWHRRTYHRGFVSRFREYSARMISRHIFSALNARHLTKR
jgi:hypothetical protein